MNQMVAGHRRTAVTAPAVRRSLGQALTYTIALVVAAIIIVPLVYVVLGGFRTTGQIAAQPVALPQTWITRNYTDVLTSGTFWLQVFNSTLIAVIATAVVVGFGALAAFPLARFEFRGREILYTLFTLGLLFPVGVAILPLYLLLRQLGLLGTALGVALPEAAFGLPVTIVILRPFMRTIPAELEDAAVIDGCSRFGFFWRILVPLSRPALTTVAILSFVGSWNAFLLPLLVLGDPNGWTLPLGVANYSTQYTQDTARILAFTALSMLPALGFFVLAERRIIGGLSGAVKG
jgi:raffinose/stachyose/melibiose transport system permease protein